MGFAVGLLSFKVKCRWCPNCGEMTTPRSSVDGPAIDTTSGVSPTRAGTAFRHS
jgi:hypothetical protein